MINYRLSRLLRRRRGTWIAWDELAAEAGLAADELPAAIEVLRRGGFTIEEQGERQEVRLVDVPAALDRDELTFAGRNRRIGRRIIIYQQTSSTNDVAAHVAGAGAEAAHGTVIVAESQKAGRGRQGAPWLDVPGESLLFSMPLWLPQPPMLAAATALAEAVEEVSGLQVGIKWPNDLEINRRKMAGILIEGRQDRTSPTAATVGGRGQQLQQKLYILGIGMNVNQTAEAFADEIRDRATSLRIACKRQIDRTLLLERILAHLDSALGDLQEGREQLLRQRYDARSDMVGRAVTVIEGRRSFFGTVVSVSPQYALVVRLAESGALRAFDAGNVRLA